MQSALDRWIWRYTNRLILLLLLLLLPTAILDSLNLIQLQYAYLLLPSPFEFCLLPLIPRQNCLLQ